MTRESIESEQATHQQQIEQATAQHSQLTEELKQWGEERQALEQGHQ